VRIAVALVEQADLAQQFLGLGDDRRARQTLDGDRRFDDVLQHGEVRKQVELLENHSHLAADAAQLGIRRVAADAGGVGADQRFACDRDGTGIDGFEVVEAAQKGALARPRRADDRNDVAPFEVPARRP
jgi:hypothetical protein